VHPRLDDDAGGLVDEDERVVLEQDLQRHEQRYRLGGSVIGNGTLG
jgi:hypothetical protein